MKLIKSRDPWFPSVFDDFFSGPFFSNLGNDLRKLGCEVPAVNIQETKSEFLFEMAAPGLSKEDFKIDLEHDNLTISCDKEVKSEKTEEMYTKREFNYYQFQRVFLIPELVDLAKIKADYENGILKVHLPKKEAAIDQPKREIKIS
jgi:HSP20 family protein